MRKIVIALIALAAVALAEDESLGNVIGIDLGKHILVLVCIVRDK